MDKIMLLFDIDGTLIYSGGAGTRSIDKAFFKKYGLKEAMKGISPDGKTDPLIIEEVFLKKLNKKPDRKEIEEILEIYLINLEKEIDNPDYKIFEGVPELLEWAQKKEKFLLGLATGNLEKGAEIKLRPSYLLKYFKFGGYASDSWERSEILRKAYEKGKKIAERENFRILDVYVIGDTPRDIEAAKRVSFKSIGMAIFRFSKEELLKAGANFVFDNFWDLKKFFEKLI
ncbi:MAG: HAD family hydrolase [candidate division WOR-3 bacterium]